MGEELSVARAERIRRPMLLARAGAGSPEQAEVRGEEGNEASHPIPRGKERAAASPPVQSKGHAAVESGVREGARGQEHREDNHTRRVAGGLAPRDTASGRSAKELGIDWVDGKCSNNHTTPNAHYWIETFRVAGGGLFICKQCRRARWLPNTYNEATVLSALDRKYGVVATYADTLDRHPAARKVLNRLKNCHRLKDAQFVALLGQVADTYADPAQDRSIWWENPTDWWLHIKERLEEARANE